VKTDNAVSNGKSEIRGLHSLIQLLIKDLGV